MLSYHGRISRTWQTACIRLGWTRRGVYRSTEPEMVIPSSDTCPRKRRSHRPSRPQRSYTWPHRQRNAGKPLAPITFYKSSLIDLFSSSIFSIFMVYICFIVYFIYFIYLFILSNVHIISYVCLFPEWTTMK